ncbi:class II fructose-1,6-bisphosphate aldolase [Oenococcus oeni]|uniref:class II fructose-1,6-bisphosphate aldolase n=1 Tax=Oenococcus oeni TaxID=1247 RepID=UPI00050F02BF|nr:class II fructose-1,6-bisphosphate aldolase [Oenococcus oeni]KGH71717.1 fructose-bisphosphate aldolase [Oenococcus oeni IOEB_0502]
MTIVNGKRIIENARTQGYAIGAFNTNNLEWTQAILRAAQKEHSPILIAVSMGAAKYIGGYKMAKDMITDLDKSLNISVPVAIHLDHGNYQAVKDAIESGFTSAMFDGSELAFEDNLSKTKELVNFAHDRMIPLEAEVGSIGGEEDGIIGNGEIASIDQAVAMARTGIDYLAAGIGNIHGRYPDNWQGLKLEHLKKLAQAVNQVTGKDFPLVLHGASGIPDTQVKMAIKYGISKININTEAQLAFHQSVRDFVVANKDLEGKNYDPRKFLASGVEAIEETVIGRIKVFGSDQRL